MAASHTWNSNKSVAVFFILLLAGQEVRAARDGSEADEAALDLEIQRDVVAGEAAKMVVELHSRGTGRIQNGRSGRGMLNQTSSDGNWLELKSRMASNASGVAGMRTESQKAARRQEITAAFTAYRQKQAAANEQPTLCQSTDWVWERAAVLAQVQLVNKHYQTVKELIDASPADGVDDHVGMANTNLLIAEAKALQPCMTAMQAGTIADVRIDATFLREMNEMSPPIDEVFGLGIAWTKILLFSTKKLRKYMKDSQCTMGLGRGGELEAAFKSRPVCEDDCLADALKVSAFPSDVRSNLNNCDPPASMRVLAYGSTQWTSCGNRFTGTTRTCTPYKNQAACCCKSAKLNGGYEDVDSGRGCTQTCTPSAARSQRSLAYRIGLVMDELFGASCDYGQTLYAVHLATKMRNTEEKLLYKTAIGEHMDFGMAQREEEDAVDAHASALVEEEERSGSLVELDSQVEFLEILLIIVVVMILLFLFCVAFPRVCEFIGEVLYAVTCPYCRR